MRSARHAIKKSLSSYRTTIKKNPLMMRQLIMIQTMILQVLKSIVHLGDTRCIEGIDKDNVYDPYACGIYKYSKEVISGKILIGHIPRELSRFCTFFLDYGGKLEATVRCTKYRRSPLPQGGLEIPVTLLIFKGDSSDDVYSRMQ